MTFVASTGQVDRNGNILDIQGWELDHYRANPVILFNHNWDLPPVGKTLQVGTEGGRLMVTIQFAPTSLGRELAILNANHYMGAASVGVRMLEWEIRRHPEHGYPIGFHSHRHELLEISVVPVPANPDTLQAAAQQGPDRVGAALDPSAAPISSGPAHLACPSPPPADRRVGLVPHPGRSPDPRVEPGRDPRVEPGRDLSGSAARLLGAINFGLRGDQC
jgi:HK97 family phage prohead protease